MTTRALPNVRAIQSIWCNQEYWPLQYIKSILYATLDLKYCVNLSVGFHSRKCVSIISLWIQMSKGQAVTGQRPYTNPTPILGQLYKLLAEISAKSEISTESASYPISWGNRNISAGSGVQWVLSKSSMCRLAYMWQKTKRKIRELECLFCFQLC